MFLPASASRAFTMNLYVCTCTTHSGVKKTHDWVVEQLADLFRTTHHTKTQHVTKSRCRHCGMSLVMDLHITHDRFGSISDPNLNGHLHYPDDDVDKSLNEVVTDKIRKYRGDYNNFPPITVSFVSSITSTSGRIHSEFIRLLSLQVHRAAALSTRLQLYVSP